MEMVITIGIFAFLIIVAFWLAILHSKDEIGYRNPYIAPGSEGLPSRAWHEYDQVFWRNCKNEDFVGNDASAY